MSFDFSFLLSLSLLFLNLSLFSRILEAVLLLGFFSIGLFISFTAENIIIWIDVGLPDHDCLIATTCREDKLIVCTELDLCDVTTVAIVIVEVCLLFHTWVLEELDLSEVISSSK